MDGQTPAAAETKIVEQASIEYLGRWNRLVSTTNWEKGRIIWEWRTALVEAGAAAQEYSDEAWSVRVGHVSSQHVGRLRRVHERFGEVRETYHGLFWSHFQAGLDWPDAEMWLEGAVQNNWSVAAMCRQRWEALGAQPAEEPTAQSIISADYDEDAGDQEDSLSAEDKAERDAFATHFEDDSADKPEAAAEPIPFDVDSSSGAENIVQPSFAHLGKLPDDLAEAFESFKLAIVRHRLDGWRDVALDDVIAALDALKTLALSPSEGV